MKTKARLLLIAFGLISLFSAHAQSNVYELNVVGYVNRGFGVGDNLFVNPLRWPPTNTLSTIFNPSAVPDGTSISLWNPTTRTFDTTSTFSSGSWSINFNLDIGTGARLTTSTPFTNTFVGEVRSHDGGPFIEPVLTPPPLFAEPNGIYLLGDKTPLLNNVGNDIFLNIIGRPPNVGEQVITLTTTSTYLGGGNWDILPSLPVSEAAFFNIGPFNVPEPSSAALALAGITLLSFSRRCQRSTVPLRS